MKHFISDNAPKTYAETAKTVLGTGGWAIVAEADISAFNTKDLYVQILCEDDKGLYVWHNVPFAEALEIPEFRKSVRCVRAVWHGYNTTSYGSLMYSEDKTFQITEYRYRKPNWDGTWLGGFKTSDFDVVRGIVCDDTNEYFGDDEKPGF